MKTKIMNSSDKRWLLLVLFVAAAAATRLLPHPANFTPLGGIALFSGAHFKDWKSAWLVPLTSLLLGDLVLGFYPGIGYVYFSFALIVLLGRFLSTESTIFRIASTTLAGSILFFAITNFGVWSGSGIYSHTVTGFEECFVAALPFFRWTLLGDLLSVGVLFGLWRLAERSFPLVAKSS